VALKRINTEQEENGFPITAIREVKILKALSHDNIVNLREIVTSKGTYTITQIYLVQTEF
jgi:cyclin-dependent kinase 12/13